MLYTLQNNFQEIITCEAKYDNKIKLRSQQNIKTLENNHVESLNEVLNNIGAL